MEQVFNEKHACQTHLNWYPFDHVKCQIIQSLGKSTNSIFPPEKFQKILFQFILWKNKSSTF